MTTTELAVRDDLTLSQLAGVMVKSGFFQDLKDASQAVVKILTGRELGFGPMASMQHVHVIKGKPSISAQMMAARIVASGTHMYRILRHDNEACILAFYERQGNDWVKVGESSFTMEDAKSAGLTDQDNWRKYKRNLLFARALSNGARWYCPHLTLSAPYVPEEMGVAVNEEGAPVDVIVVEPTPVEKKPDNGEQPAPHWSDDKAKSKAFHAKLGEMGVDHDEAKRLLNVAHLRDWHGTGAEAIAAIRDAIESRANALQTAADEAGRELSE